MAERRLKLTDTQRRRVVKGIDAVNKANAEIELVLELILDSHGEPADRQARYDEKTGELVLLLPDDVGK